MIRMENISYAYGEVPVLKNFNLHVAPGEFLTVIGRSGCGKTTMLKMINGLLMPDQGHVYVNGQDVSKADLINLRRSIGYSIQNKGLFPHMTVEKNITYVPVISGRKDKAANHAQALKMMKLVGLEESMLRRYPGELSGGQQQRVGIARALAAEPEILLMDEPFGALDEITRQTMQQELKELQNKLGLTIVFITHDIREAMRLGDRVMIMDGGRAVQLDTPEVIRSAPATEFVRNLTTI